MSSGAATRRAPGVTAVKGGASQRRRTHAIVGAGTAAAAVALLYVVAAGTTAGLSADAAGLPGKSVPGTFRAVLVVAKDALGTATAILTATLILMVASRRSVTATIVSASIIAGAVATAIALEWILNASDPFTAEGRRALGSGYFPSGHAAAAMALVLAAVVAVGHRLRLATAAVGSIAAGLIGVGILATHSHHPADVVGGFLIAAAWAGATTALSPAVATVAGGRERRRLVSAVAAALLVPAATVAGYALEQRAAEIPAGFIASALGVALAATAIVALIFRLVDERRA